MKISKIIKFIGYQLIVKRSFDEFCRFSASTDSSGIPFL